MRERDEVRMEWLASWWLRTAARCGARAAFASLCVQLGARADGASARLLAERALDLEPGSRAALMLLEQVTPKGEESTLSARYEAFLAASRKGAAVDDVRTRLIALSFAAGKRYSALRHVDIALAELVETGPSEREITLACRAARVEDPAASLDALERAPFSHPLSLSLGEAAE